MTAIQGYENFHHDLRHFFIESMQDFVVAEEDLPKYFRSNINDVYQNYAQIRRDAIDEINTITATEPAVVIILLNSSFGYFILLKACE